MPTQRRGVSLGMYRVNPIGLTIFLGAVLYFLVQPMMGRVILPWFGGSPAVWTISLLFFQAALIAGYGYAHALGQLARKTQLRLHVGLLVASLGLLPITPDPRTMSTVITDPAWQVFRVLAMNLSLPIVLLASTSPLLQCWHARSAPTARTYRLYALSNAGSLLGLLAYPFAVEPWLGLTRQTWLWSAAYAAFALLCAATAFVALHADEEAAAESPFACDTETSGPPRRHDWVLWLALSALGSCMLLAVTNQICQEVAVVPFLWVLPMTLYLGTFILAFESPRWYDRRVWGVGGFANAVGLIVLLFDRHTSILLQIMTLSGTLVAACMVCHGELARLKPGRSYLTQYYMTIALGGSLGGIGVGVIAPLVFHGYWELHASLLGCVLLLWVCIFRPDTEGVIHSGALLRAAFVVSLSLLIPALLASVFETQSESIASRRSFYGVLHVYDQRAGDAQPMRALWHGAVRHGMQWRSAARRDEPTTYYGPGSGVAIAIGFHPARLARLRKEPGAAPLRIGVVGLGAGTIAAYGIVGDSLRFYEIDSAVVSITRDYFSFIDDSAANVSVVLGDARVSLARALETSGSERFDVLVLDAFSSDSIPMHLLTREAFALYCAHMGPDGVIAFHVSNRHLTLAPIVRGLARERGLEAVWIRNDEDWERSGVSASEWVLVSGSRAFLDSREVRARASAWPPESRVAEPWTDDYGNLLDALRALDGVRGR